MTRVFLQEDQTISKEDRHHLFHVLRMKAGDSLEAVYQGEVFQAFLKENSQVDGELDLKEKIQGEEKSYQIYLLQGLPKGQKWEAILEHGTEVGIDVFIPLQMTRSLRKVDHKWEKLQDRWTKILEKAAKQSKQTRIPKVEKPCPLQEALRTLPPDTLILACYEEEKISKMKDYVHGEKKNIALIIGPEGGLDPEEIQEIKNFGGKTVTLGRNILRTETAPLVAADRIYCLMEEG